MCVTFADVRFQFVIEHVFNIEQNSAPAKQLDLHSKRFVKVPPTLELMLCDKCKCDKKTALWPNNLKMSKVMHNVKVTMAIDELASSLFGRFDNLWWSLSKCFAQ